MFARIRERISVTELAYAGCLAASLLGIVGFGYAAAKSEPRRYHAVHQTGKAVATGHGYEPCLFDSKTMTYVLVQDAQDNQ